MNITRTIEPTVEPVTLDEVKAHVRVIDAEEDAYLTGLIAVARRAIEDRTGRTLLDTVFTQSVRDWQTCIELMRGNARTVESVKYDDDAGEEQTVDPAECGLYPYGGGSAGVVFFDEFTAPDLLDRPYIDRIRIAFKAGYGDAATAVPEPLKQAVLYLVAHYYDNRAPVAIGTITSGVPFTVEALCGPYKIYN